MSEQPAELVFKPRAPDSGFRRYLENWERYFFPVATAALIFVPLDFGTTFLLLPGMIAVLWSVVILLLSLFRACLRIRSRWLQDLALPLAALFVWWLGVQAQDRSFKAAKEFAMRAAVEVQSRCDAEHRCPVAIESWNERPIEGSSRIRAGWTVKFWLTYRRTQNDQSFEINVRRNIDFRDLIEGGVGRRPVWTVTEGYN